LVWGASLFFFWGAARVAARPTFAGARRRVRLRRATRIAPGEGAAGGPPHTDTWIAVLGAVSGVGAPSLRFLFTARDGVLGERIYTNDQAAQLFWTDWLQHGD